jgi:NAD(P)H dehydrogenase (quinone)
VRVLLIHAHPDPDSLSAALRDRALEGLRSGGHSVRTIALYPESTLYPEGEGGRAFEPCMSAAEREAYSSGEPILDDLVRAYADDVIWAEALVFVYPTWWFGLPAVLKGFLDRVLVPGVAFRLDPRTEKVKPGMTNIRRVVGITTYGSSRLRTRAFNDAGRRTLLRTLRLVCNRFARSKWLGLYDVDASTEEERGDFLAKVEREMARL